MPVVCSSLFRRRRPGSNPAWPAIIADPIDGCIVYDRAINIGIVDDRGIDIQHRCIIPEMTAYPIPAGKPRTVIPATIVDTAIEADMRPPITGIPAIDPAGITPIPGRPQEADFGGFSPITRHPIISIIIVISPISRNPEITVDWANRLRIYRNNGRPDIKADAYAEYLRISLLNRQTTGS
jgi:hypothetical protein